jgi:RNA polymerase sigma factor (sigma-70 family)
MTTTSPGVSSASSVAERVYEIAASSQFHPDSKYLARNPAQEFQALVDGIRVDDANATEELYFAFLCMKARFAISLGRQEAEDRYHDLIVAIVSGIKKGYLREPTRLPGYVSTIANRLVMEQRSLHRRTREREVRDLWVGIADQGPNAETMAADSEIRGIAERVLNGMPGRDRAVLVRFYVDEEDPREICANLRLSQTQFRLIKSRAKARFANLLRRRIQPKRVRIETRSGKTA